MDGKETQAIAVPASSGSIAAPVRLSPPNPAPPTGTTVNSATALALMSENPREKIALYLADIQKEFDKLLEENQRCMLD